MAARKTKLPAKENAATKVIGSLPTGNQSGFIVRVAGEEIEFKFETYGSFKKLLKAVIQIQDQPDFSWEFFDILPKRK